MKTQKLFTLISNEDHSIVRFVHAINGRVPWGNLNILADAIFQELENMKVDWYILKIDISNIPGNIFICFWHQSDVKEKISVALDGCVEILNNEIDVTLQESLTTKPNDLN